MILLLTTEHFIRKLALSDRAFRQGTVEDPQIQNWAASLKYFKDIRIENMAQERMPALHTVILVLPFVRRYLAEVVQRKLRTLS